MMRKGQIKRIDRRDTMGQAKFVESLLYIAAWSESLTSFVRPEIILAIQSVHSLKAIRQFSYTIADEVVSIIKEKINVDS